MVKPPADSVGRGDANCKESLNNEKNVLNLEEKKMGTIYPKSMGLLIVWLLCSKANKKKKVNIL